MRITSKGQVTNPIQIRGQAGLLPHTDVEFGSDGDDVRIFPAPASDAPSRGKMIASRVLGRGDVAITTELMPMSRGES